MTPQQVLVTVLLIILITLSMREYWAPQWGAIL